MAIAGGQEYTAPAGHRQSSLLPPAKPSKRTFASHANAGIGTNLAICWVKEAAFSQRPASPTGKPCLLDESGRDNDAGAKVAGEQVNV